MDPVFRKVFLICCMRSWHRRSMHFDDQIITCMRSAGMTDYVAYMENGRLSGWKESMEVEADVWI